MKTTLRTTAGFLIGGALGFVVAYLLVSPVASSDSTPTLSKPASSDSDVIDSLKKQNALLEATVLRLKAEHEDLQARFHELGNGEATVENPTAVTQHLKEQWVQEIMEQRDPKTAESVQVEIRKLQQRYHLTPDQIMQIEPLLKKRQDISKLVMMEHLGLIGENEYKMRFATATEFNFDEALMNVLTEDQKNLYQDSQEARQNMGVSVVAFSYTEQYNINNPERFTSEQQSTIKGLFEKVLESKSDIEIPPSVQELDIDIMEKRILTIGFQELDEETFQKMYQAIVDHHQNP